MAGIYLHIPFCKTRCIYCDFYSTTFEELHQSYVQSLCKELQERRTYLKNEPIHTIYIGGGTPSQLEIKYLQTIFNTIQDCYNISHCEEVTIEVNPDDLTVAYLQQLKALPVNRISMGVQTFDDDLLRFIHRRHNADEAKRAFQMCRNAGFDNISIDLIYGFPNETSQQWEYDIKQALMLHPEHISAYCLSYEEGTLLSHMKEEKEITEIDEQSSLLFYTTLIEQLKDAGYEHYEISNFCLPDRYSRHNSAYWQGVSYLGCGAAAHSYYEQEREWNIADVHQYIKGIKNGKRVFESEQLTEKMLYEEYVMTALRTASGINIIHLKERFGNNIYLHCINAMQPYLELNKLKKNNTHIQLTQEGIFISDEIIRDLFL